MRLMTIATLVLAVTLGTSNSVSAEWRVQQFNKFNCSIGFPGNPDFEENMYSFVDNTVRYHLSRNEIADIDNLPKQTQSIQKNITENLGANIFVSTPIKWNGHYGYQFAYTYEINGFIWVRDIQYLFIGEHYYTLQVAQLIGDDKEGSREFRYQPVNKFFDSFELINKVQPSVKKWPQSLMGVWVIKNAEGTLGFPILNAGDELIFFGNRVLLRNDPKAKNGLHMFGDFVSDPNKNELDITFDSFEKKQGKDTTIRIRWKLEGETLSCTIGELGQPRPEWNQGKVQLTLKRRGDQ